MSLPQVKTQTAAPRFGRLDADLADVKAAISRSAEYILSSNIPTVTGAANWKPTRCWRPIISFAHVLLGRVIPGKMRRALNEIFAIRTKMAAGRSIPGGPSNISLSVKCYLAGKLMGMSPTSRRWRKCREWILAHGGVVECNTFTKIYLCSIGQYDYDAVPAIPPEIVLFPNWFYFNIYEISSWSRSILVPLAILYAKKPFKKLAPEQGIDELFVGGRENADLRLRFDRKKLVSWRNFFLMRPTG
jgi:squalene-hopene/tetraprenyl-beta-curcumene cyclase